MSELHIISGTILLLALMGCITYLWRSGSFDD